MVKSFLSVLSLSATLSAEWRRSSSDILPRHSRQKQAGPPVVKREKRQPAASAAPTEDEGTADTIGCPRAYLDAHQGGSVRVWSHVDFARSHSIATKAHAGGTLASRGQYPVGSPPATWVPLWQ